MDKKYKCQLNGMEYEIKKIQELDSTYEKCQKRYQAKLIQTDGLIQKDNKDCLNSWQEIIPLISKVKKIENSVLIVDEKDTPCFLQVKADNVLSFQNTQVSRTEMNKNQYYLFEICHVKHMIANSNVHINHKIDKKNTIKEIEAVISIH
jgi:hypothetical protein